FGGCFIPAPASAAIDLPADAGGSPQSPGRPSLHADPPTPERFQAAPESMARTAAFASSAQARPVGPSRAGFFDAAGFNFRTACRFAPPPFGSPSRGYRSFHYRAPLAASPCGTFTGWSLSPCWGCADVSLVTSTPPCGLTPDLTLEGIAEAAIAVGHRSACQLKLDDARPNRRSWVYGDTYWPTATGPTKVTLP